jgi:hypothetical protein
VDALKGNTKIAKGAQRATKKPSLWSVLLSNRCFLARSAIRIIARRIGLQMMALRAKNIRD